MQIQDSFKRQHEDFLLSPCKKAKILGRYAFLRLVISSKTDSSSKIVCLKSDKPYTFGRKDKYCEFVFNDRRVSRIHCQMFLDGSNYKFYIVDGFVMQRDCGLDDIRKRIRLRLNQLEVNDDFKHRTSLNGVTINGRRLKNGLAMELSVGDKISLVCGNKLVPKCNDIVIITVERFLFPDRVSTHEHIAPRNGYDQKRKHFLDNYCTSNVMLSKIGRNFEDCFPFDFQAEDKVSKALFLLDKCRRMLQNIYPVTCVDSLIKKTKRKENTVLKVDKMYPFRHLGKHNISLNVNSVKSNKSEEQFHPFILGTGAVKRDLTTISSEMFFSSANFSAKVPTCSKVSINDSCRKRGITSTPVKGFYLNRLLSLDGASLDERSVISLPELVHPVESLLHVFIATFTSDILWFLSYCEIPNNLPITVACHNSERCWSVDNDKRTSMPYANYPNLLVIYPKFPGTLAFGRRQSKRGIACHHPKLLVLQRNDSIRVVITSANLVPKQWNNVTNTIWWQDFPRRAAPDYASLLPNTSCGDMEEGYVSDFTSQLAGFMASLLVDIPDQAHLVMELSKYDFQEASGHLVASVPGIHIQIPPVPPQVMHILTIDQSRPSKCAQMKFFGSVPTSIAGIRHRFCARADSNGSQVKRLLFLLGKCQKSVNGMSEVILKRMSNISADPNAIGVFIWDRQCPEIDSLQLGFLPRDVAKWVAPLCDVGFMSFSAFIFPQEARIASLTEYDSQVQLILYISEGPKFSEISELLEYKYVVAMNSLIASIRRHVGLWRLQEVICRYKWPETQETDFLYCSSSIGSSVDAKFLAAFAVSVGKHTVKLYESEESDPGWCYWNANLELKNPSLQILFPTLKRVKNGVGGVLPSKCLLSLSEKTWQRLKSAGILYDCIPHPHVRVGYPMHVKVARRRFLSKRNASFGWIYCGSHNFSPAAWGQPINLFNKTEAYENPSSVLGSSICIRNYELGLIFVVPPPNESRNVNRKTNNLDDISLPFVVPPPPYQHDDRPATRHAMKEVLVETAEIDIIESLEIEAKEINEDIDNEVETVEGMEHIIVVPKEEDEIYVETLWSQVDDLLESQ